MTLNIFHTPGTLEVMAFHSLTPGPRVIITGAVHGNETCGSVAIMRMIDEFRSGKRRLLRGCVTFAPVVNGLAFQLGQREGDRNLNRALREYPVPGNNEDRVANVLCPLLRAHDVLIDLHSFSAEGPAFALIGPAQAGSDLEPRVKPEVELALVRALGLSIAAHGWMPAHLRTLQHRGRESEISEAVGTTEFMRFCGGAAITVECGQHQDPASIEVAYSVISRGLAQIGLIDGEAGPPPAAPILLEIDGAVFAESSEDRLVRRFRTGEAVGKDEIIGYRGSGAPIKAPYDARVIFDSGKVRPGSEMCLFCRPSQRGMA